MARITVEDCIDKFESRFELVLVASNRARKLHSGEDPTVEKDNDKNTVIALREIADETIPIDEMKNSLIQEYQTESAQNEEDLSLENSDMEIDTDIQENTIFKAEDTVIESNLEEDTVIESNLEEDTAIESNFEELENDNVDETEENHQSDTLIDMPDEDKN